MADDALLAWARRELMPWRLRPVSRQRALELYGALNAEDSGMYVFAISGGEAAIAEKPAKLERIPTFLDRAERYRRLLSQAAGRLPADFAAILCVNVNDMCFRHFDAPVFVFQRPWFRTHVLLPDPDLLRFDYFEADLYRDNLPYDEKQATGVFAGATTGRTIRARDVAERGVPRLRAAEYFLGSRLVDFRLPEIVQCENAEAEAMLAARAYTQTPRLSMAEQFAHRFLLSMDGNGATCARFALALRSRGVPLKFASDHILFYFHGLQPWLHYIPIATDDEVEKLILMERDLPGSFRAVADAGREFANAYLTREAVLRYTSLLLREYAWCFEDAAAQEPVAAVASIPSLPGELIAVAHVQDVGDCAPDASGWSGRRGSGKWIEGFTIQTRSGLNGVGVAAQAMRPTGALTAEVPADEFVGTHGRNTPLLGFCLRLTGSRGDEFSLHYEASFVDGTHSPLVPAGTVCRAGTLAPLEAMRLSLALA